MTRKLHVTIPETTLRRLDRISPFWAETFRRGYIPHNDATFRWTNGFTLDITNPNCCVIGESKNWDCTAYYCPVCSNFSYELVLSEEYDWLTTLELFITHYEQAHMKEPAKEKVPMEVFQE